MTKKAYKPAINGEAEQQSGREKGKPVARELEAIQDIEKETGVKVEFYDYETQQKNTLMGKQIDFFLTAADWAKIAAYLDKKGFVMFEDNSPTPSPVFLPLSKLGDHHIFTMNLCLKTQVRQLEWILDEKENKYRLDAMQSPCIEVISGMDSPESVFHGRFYYAPYSLENGELCPKNDEFLETTRILFTWMRRNFPARQEAKGFYASDAALKKTLLWG